MMQLDLVVATQADLPRLFDWMRQLRLVDPMESEALVPQPFSRAAMQRLIDDPSLGRAWIIRADSQPAGYIALVFSFSIEFGGRVAFIDELFIDAPFRSKGIGHRTVKCVIEQARSLGVQNLLLEVTESNAPARRLYEKCGFEDRPYRLMSKWLG